jgi:hypothetical protein
MLDFNILIVFIGSHFCLRNALVNIQHFVILKNNVYWNRDNCTFVGSLVNMVINRINPVCPCAALSYPMRSVTHPLETSLGS